MCARSGSAASAAVRSRGEADLGQGSDPDRDVERAGGGGATVPLGPQFRDDGPVVTGPAAPPVSAAQGALRGERGGISNYMGPRLQTRATGVTCL